MSAPTRLDALSSLRFFAAFAVVMLHFLPFLSLPPLAAALAREGRAGVSFFFVLSGFILYYTYHRQFAHRVDRGDLTRFWQARFARVYPLYVLTLLAITPIVLVQLQDARLAVERYGAHVLNPLHVALSWLTSLGLVNVYVPLVGGGVFTYAFLWNAPAWSIACEAVFYLVFPFFTWAVLSRFTSRRALWGLLIGLYAVELGVLVGADLAIERRALLDYATYHLPVFRIWEFFIGIVCGKLFVTRGSDSPLAADRWQGARRTITVVAVLVAIMDLALSPQWLSTSSLGPRPGQWLALGMDYALYTPLFALLIYRMAVGGHGLSSLLEWRPLVILGEASYSLYMIHWIPVTVLKHLKLQGIVLPHATIWLIIAGVVVASIGCFYGFEGPIRRLLRPREPRPDTGSIPTIGPVATP